MFFAKYIIKDRVLKLTNIDKALKETKEDISTEKSRVLTNLYDISLALSELKTIIAVNREYILYSNTINKCIRDINNVEKATDLKELINDACMLFDNFYYEEYDATSYSYTQVQNILNIDENALIMLERNLKDVNRDMTLFEPDCYVGGTFCFFNDMPNLKKYGTVNGETSAAKDFATRVAKGRLYGSNIKNDTFDVLIAKCSIAPNLEGNLSPRGTMDKAEKKYIQYINKYLRKDGIVLFVIPYFRMYKDLCEHISKYYKNIKVFKKESENNLYIFAQKDDSKTINEDEFIMLRRSLDFRKVKEIHGTEMLDYKLPSRHIPIDIFKGSSLDMDELHDIVSKTKILDTLFEEQKVEKIGESNTRPLLPFNIGQLGLVLTSGCLDGIIDEGDGHYHVVKGRVSKVHEIVSTTDKKKQTISETISNRVEINIITPNGEFKKLT